MANAFQRLIASQNDSIYPATVRTDYGGEFGPVFTNRLKENHSLHYKIGANQKASYAGIFFKIQPRLQIHIIMCQCVLILE